MDKGMNVKRGLAFLTAGLLFFHSPLAAAAGEIDSADCICETECTQEERNADCPLCGRQEADVSSCEGVRQNKRTQDAGSAGKQAEDGQTAQEKELPKLNSRAAGNDASAGLDFQWTQYVPTTEATYTAGGGQIVWTPKVSGGEVVSGTLTLKNAVINSAGIGIYVCVPVNIIVEGDNRITSGDIGICALNRQTEVPPAMNVNLSGTGSLTINSQGNGIQTVDDITVDTVRLEVIYGAASSAARGIATTGGDIVLKNSKYIKAKSSTAGIGAESSAIFAGQSGGQKIRIENSHVIAINGNGPAINALGGSIELVSSDVRAVGNTNNSLASGTLLSREYTVNGGTLFADNKGSDLAIPSVPTQPLKASNSAVLYDSKTKGLPLEGDLAWYGSCAYDEASDTVTSVGNGFIFGNVTWNDNMRFGTTAKAAITIGYYEKTAALTIPKGVTVDITNGNYFSVGNNTQRPQSRLINHGTINVNKDSISNFPNSTVVNHGTINVLNGGGIYNYYVPSAQQGGVFQNNAKVTIQQGGIFQNQGRLENSGTIEIIGTFSEIKLPNYDGSIAGEGVINGFMVEMHSDATVYAASGQTTLKKGQMLTLKPASGSNKAMKLKVPEGAQLVVEEGAVIDARTNLTKDTVASVIDLESTITVNGILLLPEDVPEETMTQISQKIAGTGTVKFGDETRYIVTVDKGDSTESQILKDGEKVVLPQTPAREGYQFEGWYIKNGNSLEPFDAETEFHESAQIVSKWTKLKVEEPEEPQPVKPEQPQPVKPEEQPKKPQPEQKKPSKTQKQPVISKADIAANTIRLNQKAKASMSGTKLKISWGKVSKASGYEIYAERCGKKYKLVKTIKGSGKTSLAISKIGKKKISKKGTYKIQITAYRIVNGKKKMIAKSLSLHVAGKNRKGYTNAKSVKVSKTKLTVKRGKTQKIKARTVKQNKRKKLFPKKHIAVYRYYSTNEKVASVSKAGTVKGKKKGTCTVYVVSANGVKRGIKVTVK
ncbi:Ig-like domain-containing protein [Lachnospiraceae bacterium MD308]|nr:Ig-like domain-containing protein [Lachnospiraceae bacterium MD308]